jgi:hypothetical protein
MHSSVRVDLDGRFMSSSTHEHPCLVVEMSPHEILISSELTPELGEQVIVYIAELGRFEGKVERRAATEFAISMELANLKREKLASQLAWLANHKVLNLPDKRRNRRFVPLIQLTTVRLGNGKEHFARINDISALGVNVEISLSVSNVLILIGSHVFVGRKAATVIRVFKGGFVAQFDEAFEEGAIDETITL